MKIDKKTVLIPYASCSEYANNDRAKDAIYGYQKGDSQMKKRNKYFKVKELAQIRARIEKCSDSDRLIFELLLHTGLRVSELNSLNAMLCMNLR